MKAPRGATSVHIKATWPSLLGLLTIAFVVLKLTGVIAWSWWLVLMPIWAPPALILTFIAGFITLYVLANGNLTRKGR